MSLRKNYNKDFQGFWDEAAECSRLVAEWPAWKRGELVREGPKSKEETITDIICDSLRPESNSDSVPISVFSRSNIKKCVVKVLKNNKEPTLSVARSVIDMLLIEINSELKDAQFLLLELDQK